jgi:hypothetical protein
MATLIESNGLLRTVQPHDGTRFTLEELQRLVGGYIEVIAILSKLFVVDEEGKLKGYPCNESATALARGCLQAGDYLAGTVVLCEFAELEEDECGS